MSLTELITSTGFGLPETVALAAVATIGYLYGLSRRAKPQQTSASEELQRAIEIANQLEDIAESLRRDLASHYAQVERFKQGLMTASELERGDSWRALQSEADRVLTPTLRLAGQVATAYDKIRQQSQAISNFSGGRTDPVTGLSNRRALAEMLEMELSGHEASHGHFCVAVLSIDASPDLPGDSQGEKQERLTRAAEFLRPELRDRDLIARYGVDEFAVVMPNTRLFGAAVFGRRLRERLAKQAGLIASCGIAESSAGDGPRALLTRADSALYSAKAAGEGLQYVHNGQSVKESTEEQPQLEPANESAQLKLAEVASE